MVHIKTEEQFLKEKLRILKSMRSGYKEIIDEFNYHTTWMRKMKRIYTSI